MHHLLLKDPLWLLALAALPLVVWLRGRARVPVLLVPFAAEWHRPSIVGRSRMPAALAVTGLALIICALARPQHVDSHHQSRSQGYDIVLAVDLSGSMASEDYVKNGRHVSRIDTIKPVIRSFIEGRPSDRIGVVVFSAKAYTLSPLTTDHEWLSRQVERIHIGIIQDGTSIGDGLGVALTRLDQGAREVAGRRKGAFIVLLTDGANNMGALSPMEAAAIAKARGIPIYTIGAGSILGSADLDEEALRAIAETTGGHFYRAAETDTVESAFREIDKAQRIEFQAKTYLETTELFAWLAIPGLALLVLAVLLSRPDLRATAGIPAPEAP